MVEANWPPASSLKPRTASGPDRNAELTRCVVAEPTLASSAPRTGPCHREPSASWSTRTYVASRPAHLPLVAEHPEFAGFSGRVGPRDGRQFRRGSYGAVCVCWSSKARVSNEGDQLAERTRTVA